MRRSSSVARGVRLSGVATAALLVGSAATQAQAEIVRLVIDKRAPLQDPDNRSPFGPYEEIRGRVFGEVDPKGPGNVIIQDLDAAPVNARGKVEYISTFTLVRPVDPAKNSGVLFAPLPNRGGRITARGAGQVDQAFYDRGYSVLWVGWQADLTEHPSAATSAAELKQESMWVPRATGRNGQPLTGHYLVRAPTGGGSGPSGAILTLDQGRAGALAYMPLSFDTRRTTLTGGPAEDVDGRSTGPHYTIAPQDWVWWDCKADAGAGPATKSGDLCVRRLTGEFKPDETYVLVFTVRDPMVMGLGLAAIRDTVSFFRYQDADAAGTANPLAGQVKYVVGQGVSQVGNLAKTVIALGFNADEKGRRVWDGANVHIAGRRIPLNYRFATPGSSATLYMPGSEGVLWWGKAVDGVRGGAPRSLLDRCEATNTCPKIFETFGGAELWNQRMTPGLVNFDLKADVPLPANVRRYYFPGTSHGGGVGGFKLSIPADTTCTLPQNPNPESDQMRALMIALVDWVKSGKEPPASAYPTLAKEDLVQAESGFYRFPKVPGAPRPYGLANPVLVYDYGPKFNYVDMSGVITKQPPEIRGRVPALVAQVGADGNETSGVPSVQHMAPLGSYLSWNTYKSGPYAGNICSFNAGFVPFARTTQERLANNDPRPSIEERYRSRAGYVDAVRSAVAKAEKDGFLLPVDGQRLVREAAEATQSGDLSFLAP